MKCDDDLINKMYTELCDWLYRHTHPECPSDDGIHHTSDECREWAIAALGVLMNNNDVELEARLIELPNERLTNVMGGLANRGRVFIPNWFYLEHCRQHCEGLSEAQFSVFVKWWAEEFGGHDKISELLPKWIGAFQQRYPPHLQWAAEIEEVLGSPLSADTDPWI